MRVLVPLGSSRTTGMVMRTQSCGDADSLRPILEVLDQEPVLDASLVKTLRFAMRWYRSEPADVLKAALPAGLNVGTVKTFAQPRPPLPLEFFYLS